MTKKKLNTQQYVRADESMKGARKVDVPGDTKAQTLEHQGKGILDSFVSRQQAAWSKLADKMVGAECLDD